MSESSEPYEYEKQKLYERIDFWKAECNKVLQENAELKRWNANLKTENFKLSVESQTILEHCKDLERIIAESQKQEPVATVFRVKRDGLDLELADCKRGAIREGSKLFASPVIQEGMVLVPITPDAKMLLAGKHTIKGMDNGEFESEIARCVYLSMLNASKEK